MINNYVIMHELGRGTFGKVKLAQKRIDEHYQNFAIKIFQKSRLK